MEDFWAIVVDVTFLKECARRQTKSTACHSRSNTCVVYV